MMQRTESDNWKKALYDRHARRLQGFFYRQFRGDEQAAADATHDTFLRAFEAVNRASEGTDEAAWLFTIAYNLLRNRYRHQTYETEYLATLDRQPTEEQQIEVKLDQQTLLAALKEVLNGLPPPLRLLFSLRHEEELTVPQVAEILQIPEGTVKSRLHKTMTIIRKQLKEYEDQ